MADHEFFLTIDLSGRPVSLDMLRELASRVLGQAGCGADGLPAIVSALENAVTRSAAGASSCRLQFIARDGRLDIAISSGGGPPWKTSHDIS